MTPPPTILAIDPGPKESAILTYRPEDQSLGMFAIADNLSVRSILSDVQPTYLAIEMIACYGMAVGKEVFETCVWIGRFAEASKTIPRRVYRKQVALHLCHSPRAKDANVRQALLDLFPATGGGSTPQVGTKSKPGPLYGISKDLWAALGVAVTAAALWPDLETF